MIKSIHLWSGKTVILQEKQEFIDKNKTIELWDMGEMPQLIQKFSKKNDIVMVNLE